MFLHAFFSNTWKASLIAKWSEMQLFKCNLKSFSVCYTMVDGSHSYWFVWVSYLTIMKHKVYGVLYLLVVFKFQYVQIKVACQRNMLIHCHFNKQILVFASIFVSIQGAVDYIKTYIFTLFILNWYAKRFYCPLIYNQVLSPFEGQQLVHKYTYPSFSAILSNLMWNILSW